MKTSACDGLEIYTRESIGSSFAQSNVWGVMLGLRNGGERRNGERRSVARPGRDRRRAERRWRLRSLLLTGLALFAPHQLRHRPHPSAAALHLSGPRVTTSISSVEPIPPAKAYDRI